jgi:hypothetical protein
MNKANIYLIVAAFCYLLRSSPYLLRLLTTLLLLYYEKVRSVKCTYILRLQLIDSPDTSSYTTHNGELHHALATGQRRSCTRAAHTDEVTPGERRLCYRVELGQRK